ncbi:MAG: GNAT family N-acetyltransferase [Planctomycetia bacterium]|nr:GNAT family N-acetyltransferase [Planctomycetia bacterium]
MTDHLVIETARPAERTEAFRLAFQHLARGEQVGRIKTALELVRRGDLDPTGIWIARRQRHVIGSMIAVLSAGASGLVWPPQVVLELADRPEIEDRLAREAIRWLQGRGAKLGQAMLSPPDMHLSPPLLRNGFDHVTTLCYLRLEIDGTLTSPATALSLRPYADDPETFHETLLRTYQATDDCPELTGIRDIDEIIEGHRSQGQHDPSAWLLACHEGEPIGVLMLTWMPDWDSWDVAYVGVTADHRRRGFGRQLMQHAIAEVQRRQGRLLTLSVDRRNRPAWELYRSLGFEQFDEREVLLNLWTRSCAPAPEAGR